MSKTPVRSIWVLSDEHLNSLQVADIDKVILKAKNASWADIRFRIDGRDFVYEADWLKHITHVPITRDATNMQLMAELVEAREKIRALEDFIELSRPPIPIAAQMSSYPQPLADMITPISDSGTRVSNEMCTCALCRPRPANTRRTQSER